MLTKLIFCALLVAVQTGGLDGAGHDQQARPITPKFLNLPSLDTKNIVGQPTIDHNSYIEHVAAGTGSSPRSGSSSHTTGSRSSTLLNKAIAEQNAVSDQPSSYTNVQVAPTSFSNDPIGIPPVNNANTGILAAGLLDPSIYKEVGSALPEISLNFPTGQSAPRSVSADNSRISSFNNNKDGTLTGFLGAAFDKINIPVPEIISVSVSSNVDDGVPSSPVKIPTVNYANDAILSTGQLGKDVITIPQAVSINSPGSASSSVAAPVKVSAAVGPAESSFLSTVGAKVQKSPAFPTSDSISLRNIAATQNGASLNYAVDRVFTEPAIGQSTFSNPTSLPSQASIDKYLSAPASDLFGLLGSGYNRNPSGILSSGFLGTPISSIFEFNGKELSPNGFSLSDGANNGNLGVGLTIIQNIGNKNGPLKFGVAIQHSAQTNVPAFPITFDGINSNNLFNGHIGNGIFANPLGFANGLFGSSYNGLNGIGSGSFGADNIFSKYFWR